MPVLLQTLWKYLSYWPEVLQASHQGRLWAIYSWDVCECPIWASGRETPTKTKLVPGQVCKYGGLGGIQPGRGKDCKNKWAYISLWNLKPETTGHSSVLQVLPREKPFNHPFEDEWARCFPLLFLHRNCTAFWTISKAAFRRHSNWKGRWALERSS